MDLVTLVAMCSIGADPEIMRSLIWQESRGRPWSFSLPGASSPQSFPSLADAVAAAVAAQPEQGSVRVGLTGLEVDLKAATAQPNEAMFAMCPNITIASERLARLGTSCAAKFGDGSDPVLCALTVWHGSWEHPDTKFADAVMLGAALGNVPNPELPSETGAAPVQQRPQPGRSREAAPEAPTSDLFAPRGQPPGGDGEPHPHGLFPLPGRTSNQR